MSKSPLTRETTLGNHAVTLVACPEGVHANLYSEAITAEQLRNLADDLDRLQEARDVYFGMKEYTINFRLFGKEDCVIIKECSPLAALNLFKADYSRDEILSVFDRSASAIVDIDRDLLND